MLIITDQPATIGRFRYLAEGRQNSLRGRTDKGFPTVAVNPAVRGLLPDGTMVRVSLVTRYDDARGLPVKHWHVLEGREGQPVDQPLVDGEAVFSNLVVKRARSDVKHSAEDQRAIRLLFTVAFEGPGGQQCLAQVASQPVFSTELKVDHVSHSSCAADAGSSIVLLTSKVQRKTVGVRITDPAPAAWAPPPDSGWVLDAQLRPTYTLLADSLETHHQFAVIAPIPPFHQPDIQAPRKVQLQLLDSADDTASPPVDFHYTPAAAAAPPPAAAPPLPSVDMAHSAMPAADCVGGRPPVQPPVTPTESPRSKRRLSVEDEAQLRRHRRQREREEAEELYLKLQLNQQML